MHSAAMRAAHQFYQFALALPDWRSPQVFAVQFDQVESDQHRIVIVAPTRPFCRRDAAKSVTDPPLWA